MKTKLLLFVSLAMLAFSCLTFREVTFPDYYEESILRNNKSGAATYSTIMGNVYSSEAEFTENGIGFVNYISTLGRVSLYDSTDSRHVYLPEHDISIKLQIRNDSTRITAFNNGIYVISSSPINERKRQRLDELRDKHVNDTKEIYQNIIEVLMNVW